MKGRALAAVIGVFLLGLLGGAVLGELYPGRGWGWRADLGLVDKHHHSGAKRDKSKRKYIRILSEELALTEQQKTDIHPLLDQARQRLYETRLTSLAQYDQIILDLDRDIRSALDVKQVEKLDELTRSFRERRSRKREKLRSSLEELRTAPQPGS